jgi:predicted HAD superfamily Cof-like phosphohydrolase
MPSKLYFHAKSGHVYEALFETAKMESDLSGAVVYREFPRAEDNYPPEYYTVWVRPSSEFFDGRFTYIGNSPSRPFDPMGDIVEFHEKYGLEYTGVTRSLEMGLSEFRSNFMMEEVKEYELAQYLAYQETTKSDNYRNPDAYQLHLADLLDALVDLTYVTLGTAYLHGFEEVFSKAWKKVHEANMAKVRAESEEESKRGSTYDVVKPAGWEAPDHSLLVEYNDLFHPHPLRNQE